LHLCSQQRLRRGPGLGPGLRHQSQRLGRGTPIFCCRRGSAGSGQGRSLALNVGRHHHVALQAQGFQLAAHAIQVLHGERVSCQGACFGPLLDRFRLGIQLGGDPAHIIAALGDRALGLGFGHFRVHFAACAKSVVPQGAGRRMHCL
jgi:hypothetical protein